MKGVSINGGRVHVWRPGPYPITRCGIRVGRKNIVEDIPDVDDTPPTRRCRQCFAGTGEA